MKLEDLTAHLDSHDDWEWDFDFEGVLIKNKRLETLTHCTFEAVENTELDIILGACVQGRDVAHITRVTGYFSKTSGWNKGKAGELKDRHKVAVG